MRELAGYGCPTRMHVVRLLAPQLDHEDHTKDIDFSPSGIMQRWDAGYRHTKAVLEQEALGRRVRSALGRHPPRADWKSCRKRRSNRSYAMMEGAIVLR